VTKPNKHAKARQPSQLKNMNLVTSNQTTQSPFEEISYLLEPYPSTQVWNILVGYSHLSHPSTLGQFVRGLCSK
jgi:hypothetical protein